MLHLFISVLLVGQIDQPANTWVKRSPLKDGPPSPMLGYEGSFGYDPVRKVVIHWAGHNQGGGGEQNAETWTFDPATAKWTLKEPNLSPPGVCCAQQNLFDPVAGRFMRFQAFSGNHGWQWFREIYLNNNSVWTYDLAKNTWRDARVVPAPRTTPLRAASWDSDHQVAVVFGGEGSNEGTIVYDPSTNTWTRMHPKTEPAGRSGGTMAYDAARKMHILFGTQFNNDLHTWAYDLAKNEWTDLKPEKLPPTDKNDAVLAYDATHQKVIASVNVFDKKAGDENLGGHYETWAYDAEANTWTKMNPSREPDGWGSRRRIMVAIPDQQVVLMESYVNPTSRVPGVDREQQIWTYRFGPVVKDQNPPTPEDFQVTTTGGRGVLLSWKPTKTDVVVYKGNGGPEPWKLTYRIQGRYPAGTTEFLDKNALTSEPFTYYVRAVDGGRLSEPSPKRRAQPGLVEDVVVSVLSPKEAEITWPKSAASDVVGYHIERALVTPYSEDQINRLKKDTPPLAEPSVGGFQQIDAFVRITDQPIKDTTFRDVAVDLTKIPTPAEKPIQGTRFREDQLDKKGKPYRFAVYAYRVRAVNALGVESGPGPFALTIPSSPQWVFSKEAGSTCRLKWQANPEKGLAGYRVYRMESPRVNGPGQPTTRVTPEPVKEITFADPNAGMVTRRYWVVAVDALGQEGFTSAPVWFERQYKKVYDGFTGEWHQ